MNKLFVVLLFILVDVNIQAQPNCELLKEDKNCYASCRTAMKAIKYKQGSYKSQELFDKSLELCSSFAYSYMQKAVPFLKRGQFIKWKKLIDKAVEISPTEYLAYRGWCRLQFLRDYHGAIADLEELKNLVNTDIGYCQTGDYHLEIVRAMCYKEIGELNKAKKIFEDYLNSNNYSPGLYDFYHLGVIEYELGNYKTAIALFNNQIKNNEIAEPYFFLALAYKKLEQNEKYNYHLLKSQELYIHEKSLYSNYTEPIDKIYLKDILDIKNMDVKK